ncbi:FG-GAP repeat domain-containing protein [Streptomyces sp. NPDC014861]|uniref:FG-GAP repeat domain-containing protein n=1 Tax=Streptomyces sp. NPDC014861 TaxID=3364923 RepID=UPI0036F4DBE9
MSKRMRRATAMTGVAGLMAVAGVTAGAGPAVAMDEVRFSTQDMVFPPGTNPRLGPWLESGTADGRVVIALSTKPLTGPAGDGAGVPKGFTVDPLNCTAVAAVTAVYLCRDGGMFPQVTSPLNAPNLTTVHWGFAYVPQGGSLAAGIEAARTAGARPADATHGTGKAVVKTAAHAALNTVGYEFPDLSPGRTVHHRLRIHSNDAGRLRLGFRPAEGQESGPVAIDGPENFATSPGLSCRVDHSDLAKSLMGTFLWCEAEAGDHTIDYDVTAGTDLRARKVEVWTAYGIYDWGGYEYDVNRTGAFTTLGPSVRPRHFLLARDSSGALFRYSGTGVATAPFGSRTETADGWQGYNAITALSPLKNDPVHRDRKPSAVTRGRGDTVARDASGTLWYYDRQFVSHQYAYPFAARVRVGTGWNVYDRIDGAGDIDRDGYVDLLARDKAGVLWLYRGTGRLVDGNRFKTRVKVGAGWGVYDRLAGGTDLSGDGRADLLARDKAGVLWLYKGTGSGTTPYSTRTRVGAGWGAYDQLVGTGDLTDDGRADTVARDRAGVLWLYRGTGKAAAPFTGRSRIGAGWGSFNRLF